MEKRKIMVPKFDNCPILGQRYVGLEEKEIITNLPRRPRKSKKRRTQKFF